MPSKKPQTLGNHRRWNPLYHFFVLPLLAANVVATIWHAIRIPTTWNTWQCVMAVALLGVALAARGMALVVQDRVIRLEMRLRLREVLPAALAARVGELTKRQLVALRFAGDAELPALVERCLDGELVSRRSIKREVRDWQADWLRV